jgi:hypothetical protein
MPEIEIRVPAPLEIEASPSGYVVVDVTNKAINLGSLESENIISVLGYTPADASDVQERWNNFVQLNNVTLGDTLIHDGSTFTNRPKQELSDGGNF